MSPIFKFIVGFNIFVIIFTILVLKSPKMYNLSSSVGKHDSPATLKVNEES